MMPTFTTETPAKPEVIYHPTEPVPSSTEPAPTERTRVGVTTTGSSLETLCGAGAVVLAIIALAGYLHVYLIAIATIAVGVAVLAHGVAVAVRSDASVALGKPFVLSDLGSELLGGIAGIVLGILALVGLVPVLLLSIAAIAVGGAVLFGGSMLLGGIGAAVLGILALLHIAPAPLLIAIAMLAVGAAMFVSGGALTARFARRAHRA
ncbi:MAG TPA: hypothetical protein VLX92_12825 [Kofleriaceae bacterium]|nr:hypothetical protein [Kofleriaceae bacterium]